MSNNVDSDTQVSGSDGLQGDDEQRTESCLGNQFCRCVSYYKVGVYVQ